MRRREFLKSTAAAAAAVSIKGLDPGVTSAQPTRWLRLSSCRGELPVPSTSREQTGDIIGRFDKDSPCTDFVLSFRVCGPALVWYRRLPSGRWDRYIVDRDFLPLEAGGTAFDVDGDGNCDIICGEDWQGSRVYWWENPYPNFDPDIPWKRHVIKDGGATQHHDMIVADIEGSGNPQLYFWNQGAKTLFMARIPDDPRNSGPWNLLQVYSGNAGEGDAGSWGWTHTPKAWTPSTSMEMASSIFSQGTFGSSIWVEADSSPLKSEISVAEFERAISNAANCHRLLLRQATALVL